MYSLSRDNQQREKTHRDEPQSLDIARSRVAHSTPVQVTGLVGYVPIFGVSTVGTRTADGERGPISSPIEGSGGVPALFGRKPNQETAWMVSQIKSCAKKSDSSPLANTDDT